MNRPKDIIKVHENGVIFKIFVKPNSKSSIFPKGYNKWRECIDVDVCASAEKNRANKETIRLIANFFDKDSSDIHIIDGSKSREKTIFIREIDSNFVYEKLRGSLNGL